MKFLTLQHVLLIHDQVIGANELQGLAGNKSLDAVIARIENRIHYAMIEDLYELAACYASYIAVGHVFNDANKRTAYASMRVCLALSEASIDLGSFQEVGDMMIRVAERQMDEKELARWLRRKLI